MKAPAKLVCLETYWNEKLFESFSVKPFLDAMAPLVTSAAAGGAPVRGVGAGARVLRCGARTA